MKGLQELYQEYWELLSQQQFNEADLDFSILENHINFLEQLDRVGNSAISIFDLSKKDHVFMSKNYGSIFGYDLQEVEKEGWEIFR